jgi:threonine dehydrogenase-like Zn-dependent dehydrogenase
VLNVVTIEQAQDRTLIGDRGVATLGHRDHALIPYQRFVRVPPRIADEDALLGVLAADARHALDMARVETGEDCLVIGGGILGVLTAWELALHTRGTIRLVETNAGRREILERIRFPGEVTVSDRPGRYPFHTCFECANSRDAFVDAQRAARPGGSVVVVADGSHETYALAPDFFARGLYLGKTGANPDLRRFLNEWFARSDDRGSLIAAAFQETLRFDEFPQSYLKSVLAPAADHAGLLPRVVYS